MLNKTHIEELNSDWVYQHLHDVTTNDAAWVFSQEPGFIGFGVVMQDSICFPSDVNPDWQLTIDLRLFGEKGEWHVWRDWDGEHYARLLTSDEMEKKDTITEHHFLWGTEKVDVVDSPWIKVIEKRGAEIWLPLKSEKFQDSDLPFRLELKQIVSHDPETHLAGITDAALVSLTKKDKNRISLLRFQNNELFSFQCCFMFPIGKLFPLI